MFRRFALFFIIPMTLIFAEENPIENVIKSMLEMFQGGDAKEDRFAITSHSIDLSTGPLAYKAITGTLDQYTDDGKIAGELFFTAYLKENGEQDRPVTFIFNGGPGGSSLALHTGGLGPRRILLPEEGQSTVPPFQMTDNQETLLDTSDLIFIDPMSTGYSQPSKPEYKPAYYSVEGDLYSFTEFMRMFCIHFDRWNSPKYLLGASYGTSRACGLTESLLRSGIYLNGVILVSCALDLTTLVEQREFPLAYGLRLPTFAATSWFHGKTMQGKTLPEVIEYARNFVYNEYLPFMMQPSRLNATEQLAFYQKLSDLIGLSVDTLWRNQAKIDEPTYTTEFLASKRQIIGGSDSRYIGDTSFLKAHHGEDPSYQDVRPALYTSFLNYMQGELETQSKFPKYISFSTEAFLNWNWWTYDNQLTYPNFTQRLRRSLVANPNMKVFIGSGYYDIRTPFAAAEYSLDQLVLPKSYQQNFQSEYYEAGHGFIFDLASLKKFKQDLKKFYTKK